MCVARSAPTSPRRSCGDVIGLTATTGSDAPRDTRPVRCHAGPVAAGQSERRGVLRPRTRTRHSQSTALEIGLLAHRSDTRAERHTHTVRSQSWVLGLCVTVLVLTVTACSGGNPTRATSATTNPSPTTGGRHRSVEPLPRRRALGPCPAEAPAADVTELNAGVAGLSRQLVPLTSLIKVRVCTYSAGGLLYRSAVLKRTAAADLEVETNELRTYLPSGAVPRCVEPTVSLVNFLSSRDQVEVYEDSCGVAKATNGVLTVHPTVRWLNRLRHYTTTRPKRHQQRALNGPTALS
jgi:hypothetical protein